MRRKCSRAHLNEGRELPPFDPATVPGRNCAAVDNDVVGSVKKRACGGRSGAPLFISNQHGTQWITLLWLC